MRRYSVLLVATLFVFAGLAAWMAQKTSHKPIQVRWLIAHEPADAFTRAAATFAAQLKQESKGEMELVVLMPKDVGALNGNVEPKQIFELLANGNVELSQTITNGIGEIDSKFFAFDLPFLFRDHEHAAKVLEGPIGEGLLASLEKNKIHGLAFTYSGGFRIIPSTEKEIRGADDFKGLRVRTTNSPVSQAMLKELGAIPVPLSLEQGQSALNEGDIDAAETTYVRVTSVIGEKSKVLNETHHSLFLTSILASDRFFKSLSPANREALKRSALAAARIEREDSVADGLRIRGQFEKSGVKVVRMTPKGEAQFRERVKPIYTMFEEKFGKTLIDQIAAVK